MCRRHTRICVHRLDFQSKNFSYVFYRQNLTFVCEFQHIPLWKLMIFLRFHTSCGHEILPNSPRIKNPKRLLPYLLWKVVFWTPKDCCPPWAGVKNPFSSTLNVMISQMVRNENVRFGRRINIEVSYKIL
jgi:hypothetical protein